MKYIKKFESQKYFGIKKDDIVIFLPDTNVGLPLNYGKKYIVEKVFGLSKKINTLMEEKEMTNNDSEPEVGDYVIMYSDYYSKYFSGSEYIMKNNIGQITEIHIKKRINDIITSIFVDYDGYYIPDCDNIKTDIWKFYNDDIQYFSKNKEELIPFLLAKKYNL